MTTIIYEFAKSCYIVRTYAFDSSPRIGEVRRGSHEKGISL